MRRRTLTAAPILVGGVAGSLVAWFGAHPRATPSTVEGARPETLRPAASVASLPTAALSARAPTASTPTPRPSATVTASAAPAIAPSADRAPLVVPARFTAPIFDLSPPTTEPTLMAAQLGCNKQSPEDCERAGRSLESGSAGAIDAARARGLRRIALTLYVKQCESGRVAACVRLAEMYDAGDIVAKAPKNAEALRVRAEELCAKRPSDGECRR